MATLAESFLEDLNDLSDEEEVPQSSDVEEVSVKGAFVPLIVCRWPPAANRAVPVGL